jgi:hypothetical protein
MQAFRQRLHGLVEADWPMTVRHAFYLAVADGLVEKTEKEYGRVQRQLALMRRDSWSIQNGSWLEWPRQPGVALDEWARFRTAIPFEWIADTTRWVRRPRTFDSMDAALKNTMETYRRSLWNEAPEYVEIWCESDSIAGVIYEETAEWDVPLQVVRGMSSISYLYSAAQNIVRTGKPAFLYYFGDYDKTGMDIDRNVERDIRDFAGDAEIYFERVAITPLQIDAWELPTKPSSKHKDFPDTVELEAVPPDQLRGLVRDCIEQHVDPRRLRAIEAAEESERELLGQIYETYRGGAA